MDMIYSMLFDEVRRGLAELRGEKYHEAMRTLEGTLLMHEFLLRYRRRDAQALRMWDIMRRLEWERTPEGRLEWERLLEERRRGGPPVWDIEGTPLGDRFREHRERGQ